MLKVLFFFKLNLYPRVEHGSIIVLINLIVLKEIGPVSRECISQTEWIEALHGKLTELSANATQFLFYGLSYFVSVFFSRTFMSS